MEPGSIFLLVCTTGLVVLLVCICMKSTDDTVHTPTLVESSHLVPLTILAAFQMPLALPTVMATDREEETRLDHMI